MITSAFSVSRNRNHVFRVPLWDIAAQRSATGGYPWYIEGDSSTMVYIKNVTGEPRQYRMYLKLSNGDYVFPLTTVAPNQTKVIDVRELRDTQVPDVNGQTISLTETRGQVQWSMTGGVDRVLIGRSEQVDLIRGTSSNYACQNCCGNSFYDGWITPIEGSGFEGEELQFTAMQSDANCYGQIYPGYPANIATYTSTNNSICNPNWNTGTTTGLEPGEAIINAAWTGDAWFMNIGEYCDYTPVQAVRDALCQVAAGPDHLILLVDQQGYTNQVVGGGTCANNYFMRQVQFQVVSQDSNGASPVGNVVVRELFGSVSTNTCGNGQPIASGCAPTINNGTFIDSITVNCAGYNGPANCGYDINWGWHWCGRINTPIVKLASLSAEVRRDSITLNGQSGAWPSGTAFRR